MEEKYKEKKIEYKGQKGRTYGTERKQMDKVEQRARSKEIKVASVENPELTQ